MIITDDSLSHHMPTTKSTPFVVSKDKWDTKEGPGKSMKNVLYVLQCRDEATSNSKNIKPIALAIIKLHLSEGIRQLVGQSEIYYIIFFLNSVMTFRRHFWLI